MIVKSDGASVKHFWVAFQKLNEVVPWRTAPYRVRMRMHDKNNKTVTNVALIRTPVLNPMGPFSNVFNMIVCIIPPSATPEAEIDIIVARRRLKWCERIAKLGTYINPWPIPDMTP